MRGATTLAVLPGQPQPVLYVPPLLFPLVPPPQRVVARADAPATSAIVPTTKGYKTQRGRRRERHTEIKRQHRGVGKGGGKLGFVERGALCEGHRGSI